MGQVLEFKPRKVEDKRPTADVRPMPQPLRSKLRSAEDMRPRGEGEAKAMATVAQFIDLKAMGVEEMIKQSAVMQVVSTLAFYARQGYDGGEKARRALVAMREIMGAEASEAAPAV